jgi:hypothetical protein
VLQLRVRNNIGQQEVRLRQAIGSLTKKLHLQQWVTVVASENGISVSISAEFVYGGNCITRVRASTIRDSPVGDIPVGGRV